MQNSKEFEKIIADNRYTITSLSKAIGITPTSLFNKISGRTDFKISEILSIKKALNLSRNDVYNLFFCE